MTPKSARHRRWLDKHRVKHNAKRRAKYKAGKGAIGYFYHIKHAYGLTEDAYAAMFDGQKGRCAICNSKGKLVVDHCHKTGAVRGLLCAPCNHGIGSLKDDPRTLESAIIYLTNNKSI